MAKTIYIQTEEYTGGDQGDFYTFALTGDTYEAKEIIKSLGFTFSDQVGHGKAWRTPVVFKSDFVPGNAEFMKIQKMVVAVRAALLNAGYQFSKIGH